MLEQRAIGILALSLGDATFAEIGRRINLSRSQVARIFRGQKPATFSAFLAMCDVLGVDPAEVLEVAAHGVRQVSARQLDASP